MIAVESSVRPVRP